MPKTSKSDLFVVVFAAWLFIPFLLAGSFLTIPKRTLPLSADPYWLAILALGGIGGAFHGILFLILRRALFTRLTVSFAVGVASAAGTIAAVTWKVSPLSNKFSEPIDQVLLVMLFSIAIAVAIFVASVVKNRI